MPLLKQQSVRQRIVLLALSVVGITGLGFAGNSIYQDWVRETPFRERQAKKREAIRRANRLFAAERRLESRGAIVGKCEDKGTFFNWVDLSKWSGSARQLNDLKELVELVAPKPMFIRLGPALSDESLSIIVSLPRLTRLEVSLSGRSQNKIRQLKSSLPDCEVGSFQWCR